MTYDKKVKVVAVGVTAALFSSLIGTGILYRTNTLLSEDYKAEKVRTESLEAEKASLKKEIDKLKIDLSNFDIKNKDLDKAVKEAQYKLAEREARVAKLEKENASIHAIRKENEAIRKIRKDLVAQLEDIKRERDYLQNEVSGLNQLIASLRKENEMLQAKIGEKPLTAYNFLVEVLKKKEKLTVKAKRTHKVNISFDVNTRKNLANDIYIKVRSPKSEVIKGETLVAFSELPEDSLMASLDDSTVSSEEYSRVTIEFDPEDKLVEGTYNVMVYSGNVYLGSTQFKLRR